MFFNPWICEGVPAFSPAVINSYPRTSALVWCSDLSRPQTWQANSEPHPLYLRAGCKLISLPHFWIVIYCAKGTVRLPHVMSFRFAGTLIFQPIAVLAVLSEYVWCSDPICLWPDHPIMWPHSILGIDRSSHSTCIPIGTSYSWWWLDVWVQSGEQGHLLNGSVRRVGQCLIQVQGGSVCW